MARGIDEGEEDVAKFTRGAFLVAFVDFVL
jgi:hypothetical protein